jgi:hypothetical protein
MPASGPLDRALADLLQRGRHFPDGFFRKGTCPSKNGQIGQLSSGADQDPVRRPAPSKYLPNRIDKRIG